MQRNLEEMETAHATVIKTIAQHEAILNPLRSIPDDMLLAIFQWSSSSDTQGLDSMSSSRAPWTLSHVSRRWRNLSISSPRLWTNININFRDLETSTRHERDRMSFKLNLHVRRSAECDLFVRVISHLRNRVTFLDECFGLLLPTAHRWKTLSVSVHSSALALQLAESRFERLTKMEMNLWEPIRQVPWHVPNIRDLRLSGRPFEAVDFPWESITSYVCNENGVVHLPKLSALEDLKLDIIEFSKAFGVFTSMDVSFPLTLQKLRSISLWQKFSSQSIDILSQIFLLPSLTSLTVRMGPGRWRFPTFNGSIRHLQNLCITSSSGLATAYSLHDTDKPALISFLADCTSVTALYLEINVAEKEILHALADESALPKLTSLRIAVQLMWDHPGFVLGLVESRCQTVKVAPLTELRIVEIENNREARWTEAETVTEDVMERWNSICGKMNVLTVFENSF